MQVAVGENIVLVGTAHVSRTSVEDVKSAIATHRPQKVCVELDEPRHKAITQKRDWNDTPVTALIKDKKLYFFLAQIMLASYQRRMGLEEGVEPGAEMVAAIGAAGLVGSEVVLADRDIGITFRRAFAAMGFGEKMRVSWELMKALVGLDGKKGEEIQKVDDLLDQDLISTMMAELGDFAPSIKSVLIDERDLYLATRIRDAAADGTKVVAVVGAGHLQGIKRQLEDPQPVSIDLLEEVPEKKVKWGKIVGWGIPLLILGMFAYLGYEGWQTGNWQKLREAALDWILINGLLSALGALLARGHILSVLTAFVAAPITSLNPTIAAGWFAGFVEAVIRKPKVEDFNNLASLATFGDFFRNRVTRVIMVAALANVGSMIGTYIAGVEVFKELV